MFDTILETGRQSLVTPIDWNLPCSGRNSLSTISPRRQSLVTPIDWKLEPIVERGLGVVVGRQSLVTPIDLKHTES